MLEVREVKLSNLADGARACVGSNLPPGLDSFGAVDMQRAKVNFLRDRKGQGAGARAAYRDGVLVGSMDWYPLERSPTPVAGEDLFVVNCARVLEPAVRTEVLGAMLESAAEAWSKRAGVAAVGRRRSLEEFGWEEVDRGRAPEGGLEPRVLFLKRFRPGASARFLEVKRLPPPEPGRIRVDLFRSDRCPWNGWTLSVVRRALDTYGRPVQLFEHDANDRRVVEEFGVGAGVAVNGKFQPFLRPHLLPDERSVHKVLDLA